jgi:flagellar protein FlaG
MGEGAHGALPTKQKEVRLMSSKIETSASSFGVAVSAPLPAPVARIEAQDIAAPSPTAAQAKHKVEQELKQMVAKEANIQDIGNLDLSFGVDKATERVYAQVKDKKTGEVVKQIPSKEFLDMMARINGAVDGMFIDARG